MTEVVMPSSTPSLASRTAKEIVDEFRDSGFDRDPRAFVLETYKLRNEYSGFCQKILIFLAVDLLVLAAWVLFGFPDIEVAATHVKLDYNFTFFGFVIGNMLYVLQIGAFFKVVVAEKVLESVWQKQYPMRTFDRVLLGHNSQIGHRAGSTKSAKKKWIEIFSRWYIGHFFLALYSLFYYFVLSVFIIELLSEIISQSCPSSLQMSVRLLYLFYAIFLIGLNAASAVISYWLLRDLRPEATTGVPEDAASNLPT